jgi:hypothetical protein
MDYFNLIIGFISAIVSAISLTFAIKTNREKNRLEKLIKCMLANFAGNAEMIRINPHWADKHFRDISTFAQKVTNKAIGKKIIDHAHQGARDVTAAERMLRLLRNNILSLQEGLFNTRDIEKFDIPNPDPTFIQKNIKQYNELENQKNLSLLKVKNNQSDKSTTSKSSK